MSPHSGRGEGRYLSEGEGEGEGSDLPSLAAKYLPDLAARCSSS